MSWAERDAILLELLEHLARARYRFVTPTPETHRRVLARKPAAAEDLRDAFGWNLPFGPGLLPPALLERMAETAIVQREADLHRSRVRIASVGDRLFLHSAYPTIEKDAVFLGPDSYRFVRFLEAELADAGPVERLVDVGAGSGVGAIAAAALVPGARLTLTDVNPLALRYARLNATHAGLEAELVEGSGLDPIAEAFDLVIANPPYMADAEARTYRHGGGLHGGALSLEWALAAARRVAPGGRVLLYTGSAIVGGEDRLERALRERLPALDCTLRYAEIDPDIFGEQLDEPGYETVERIAAIGAVIERAP